MTRPTLLSTASLRKQKKDLPNSVLLRRCNGQYAGKNKTNRATAAGDGPKSKGAAKTQAVVVVVVPLLPDFSFFSFLNRTRKKKVNKS